MVVKGFRAAGRRESRGRMTAHTATADLVSDQGVPRLATPSYNTATSSEAWLSRLAVCLWICSCWCCTLQGDCRCALRQTMSGGYAGLVVGPAQPQIQAETSFSWQALL